MLLGIEVIQGSNARNQTVRQVAEHRHEGRVPEEDVLVERGIDKLRRETAAGKGLMKMAKRQFPGFPVDLNKLGLFVVDRGWQ